MKYLMHINTGSIDTYENWESDAKEGGWSFEDAISDGSLFEVIKEDGRWVEDKE